MNISTININAKESKRLRKVVGDKFGRIILHRDMRSSKGLNMKGAVLLRNKWNGLVPTHTTKGVRVKNYFVNREVAMGGISERTFNSEGIATYNRVNVRIEKVQPETTFATDNLDGIRTYYKYVLAEDLRVYGNTYKKGTMVWADKEEYILFHDKQILTCKNCGKPIVDGEFITTKDTGNVFCLGCEGIGYVTCDECGDYVENYRTADNDDSKHICETCFDELDNDDDFFVCDNCGDLIYDSDRWHRTFIDSSGDLVCDDCRDNNYRYCCECEEWVHEDDAIYVDSIDDYVCDDCLNDHYAQCYHCEEYFPDNGEHGSCDEYGDFYCDNCINNGHGCFPDRDDDEALRGYHSGRHDYGGNVGTYGMDFLTYESCEDNPLMGIENEIDEGGESGRNARQIRDEIGEDYVICSEDGSLSCGFELVSCPAALYHHMNTIGWKEGFRKARELGYTSHNNGRCGLHIHIDRDYDNSPRDTVENNYIILFRNNLWWLKAFSRRDDYNPNRSEPWYYCQPNGEGVLNDEDILDGESVKNKKFLKSMKGRGHYVAMNMEHENTIELRFFRGTLRYNTFIATLQLVDMWARLIKGKEEEEVAKINLESFIAMAHEREYDEFMRYLDERHITRMAEPKRKLVRYTETEDIRYIDCY